MRRVVVLRPEPGASATVERARERGLDAIAIPLFRVESVEWTAPEQSAFDGLLLTSANAVRHAGKQLHSLRGLRVYAVGSATADAAREAGFDIASTGDSGVERLLGSVDPELRLLHLCGADTVDFDAPQSIEKIVVYRAEPLPRPDLSAIADNIALVHSPGAARRLAELVRERSSTAVAAISPAAAAAVGDGWEAVIAADQPNEDALLALAASLCNKPSPK
jgi:uroporphyrinogen-III synthase